LREITRREGSLLIFDEVITGFRVGRGGAQELFGIRPDLTCLGKVIGGGLPVGAFGGRADLMERLAPSGPVYQAGTLSGNPLAVAAGQATLDALDRQAYDRLNRSGERLAAIMTKAARDGGVDLTVNHFESLVTPCFTSNTVIDYQTAKQSDTRAFAAWFHRMLEAGILLPPSQFEAAFISTAHDDAVLDFVASAASASFQGLFASQKQA
jgi:glutamate-1-semialdehyde 2,1-aminomutase